MDMCPGPELLSRFIAGKSTADEYQEVQTHLSECETCRHKVKSARTSAAQITQEAGTGEASKEEQIRQDEFTTKSMPDVPVLSSDAHISAKSLDSMFEGYEILEELPHGGQAVVYKAIQKATKRTVAVKVLLQGPYASARAQYRFEREVDLAANLRHPNIVTIYDSGIARGQYYFAMEYVQGKPLDQYVRWEKLPIRETMILFSKVCSAVAYAHQRGVMHRDLKPSNILVDADGQPHILDFGLAKLTGDSEQAAPEAVMTSMTGQIIGTLAFMSPEQASGQPNAVDVRTDVYSIGVILYQVLTESFPYDIDGSTLQTLRNIQEAEPTRPSKLVRLFNSDVEAILLKALAKEPAYRYQSAAELQHDIEYWLKGLPIAARADNSIYLLRKLLARHRYTSAVLVLLAVIVLGFSYVSFDLYVSAKNAQQESEAIAEHWATEAAKGQATIREMTVPRFLEIWHNGPSGQRQVKAMSGYADYLPKDSKERKAFRFLLDSRPLAEKEPDFHSAVSGEYTWFADMIVGEHHLKDGNRQEAIKAYQRSYAVIDKMSPGEQRRVVERWLAVWLLSRLNELNAPYRSAEEASDIGGED